MPSCPILRATLFAALSLLLSACGGGSDSDPVAPPVAAPVPAPAPNMPPVATISIPAPGATFKAGDVIAFAGSATDAEDGQLAAGRLVWWAEFHHDDHTHPFTSESTGGSGNAPIPVRGETAENVFYRFHLRATDAAGAVHVVTRDVVPLKAQITLASQPAGLQLSLDGQPVAGGTTVTGVVGIERDLGAAVEQLGNGRRWRFANWSDGGSREHVISTPAANTTYTATFTDIGPINNQSPSIAMTTPSSGSVGTLGTPITLSANATDSDGRITKVEFFDGGFRVGEDVDSPYALDWTPPSTDVHILSARATDDQGATTTSVGVAVTINAAVGPDISPPTVAIMAPLNLTSGLAGILAFNAIATDNVGVAAVEFQLDGVAIGSADTSAPYGATIDVAAYPSGQHVLRARSRDTSGNRSTWAVATVEFSGGGALPAGFTMVENLVRGLSRATAFAQAPNGGIFIAEQNGTLRVFRNGALQVLPFVTLSVDSSGERGLIGVVLHPEFANNGYVYVYSTRLNGGIANNRISRFTANGDLAVAGSEVTLVDLPALSNATNHNGGAMHFGIDGKLYVGVGENASPSKAQNLADPFGKLLRFNDDGSIPTDNPFYTTQTGLARAIWAYGLRNPFTFAIQPGSGRIHINDVGQAKWEEINLGAPGANYGWPASEGPDNIGANVSAPLFTYFHGDSDPRGSGPGGFFSGYAIAGGAFYPANGPFPAGYRSQYYFGDYISKYIGRLDLANGNAAYRFAKLSGTPVDLLVGVDGALYVLTRTGLSRISAP